MPNNGFSIKCDLHHYITLKWNDKFIFCLDNDLCKAEEMIYKIEKRTGMNFKDIRIDGDKSDFQGLMFFNGGWKRDFWKDFPTKAEIESYINIKR